MRIIFDYGRPSLDYVTTAANASRSRQIDRQRGAADSDAEFRILVRWARVCALCETSAQRSGSFR